MGGRGEGLPTLRVIGPGRAGGALGLALQRRGWRLAEPVRHGDDPGAAAEGVDLLVVATPDAVVAEVAEAVRPRRGTVVAHLAGSLGLDVLAPHAHRASLHPLMTLPSPEEGAGRLPGAWFGVAANDATSRGAVDEVVAALGGRAIEVPERGRTAYHAAATIASNHLVALLGQVERVAATAGVPLEAYLPLVRASVDNADRLGPPAALTGPVARGDWVTVERHLDALAPDERPAYRLMAELAHRLIAAREPGPGEAARSPERR